MAVELTPDEQAKVANARLIPRPEYFSAQAGRDQQISEDFESFLILQDDATIAATLPWLTTTGLLSERRMDRDSVAFEALVVDMKDREAVQTEVDDLTSEFNEWKAAFKAGKFSDVSEVGLVIADMQATAEEIFVLQERVTHLERVHTRVADRLRQNVSNAQLRQLQSWPVPLLTY